MAQRVTPAETRGALAESANLLSRFELAPPRGFLLPGILLLLSEEPGYGYNLVKGLKEFRFGRVDRPSVYRALAQLEADGLVESWSEASKAGNPRHVYRLTGLGEDVLRGVDGCHQGGARVPRARAPALSSDRNRRRRARGCRRRLGQRARLALVAGVDDVAGARPDPTRRDSGRRPPASSGRSSRSASCRTVQSC